MTRSVRTSLQTAAAALLALTVALAGRWPVLAQAPTPAASVTFSQTKQSDLQEWLTYLSSDELLGRETFSEGYGVAAQYIASRLEQWGVKPLGDHGTYFQMVKLKGYRVTRNSSVTVTVNGQTRTFKHGD